MQVGAAAGGAFGAARQDDVLVISLAGAVTTRTYDIALDRASQEIGARPIRALIIDISRAAPLGEWDDGWQASEGFCLCHHMPLGLVATTKMLATMRRQCFRVSALGITWVAFLRLDEARLWAASWSGMTQLNVQPQLSHYEHPTPQFLH